MLKILMLSAILINPSVTLPLTNLESLPDISSQSKFTLVDQSTNDSNDDIDDKPVFTITTSNVTLKQKSNHQLADVSRALSDEKENDEFSIPERFYSSLEKATSNFFNIVGSVIESVSGSTPQFEDDQIVVIRKTSKKNYTHSLPPLVHSASKKGSSDFRQEKALSLEGSFLNTPENFKGNKNNEDFGKVQIIKSKVQGVEALANINIRLEPPLTVNNKNKFSKIDEIPALSIKFLPPLEEKPTTFTENPFKKDQNINTTQVNFENRFGNMNEENHTTKNDKSFVAMALITKLMPPLKEDAKNFAGFDFSTTKNEEIVTGLPNVNSRSFSAESKEDNNKDENYEVDNDKSFIEMAIVTELLLPEKEETDFKNSDKEFKATIENEDSTTKADTDKSFIKKALVTKLMLPSKDTVTDFKSTTEKFDLVSFDGKENLEVQNKENLNTGINNDKLFIEMATVTELLPPIKETNADFKISSNFDSATNSSQLLSEIVDKAFIKEAVVTQLLLPEKQATSFTTLSNTDISNNNSQKLNVDDDKSFVEMALTTKQLLPTNKNSTDFKVLDNTQSILAELTAEQLPPLLESVKNQTFNINIPSNEFQPSIIIAEQNVENATLELPNKAAQDFNQHAVPDLPIFLLPPLDDNIPSLTEISDQNNKDKKHFATTRFSDTISDINLNSNESISIQLPIKGPEDFVKLVFNVDNKDNLQSTEKPNQNIVKSNEELHALISFTTKQLLPIEDNTKTQTFNPTFGKLGSAFDLPIEFAHGIFETKNNSQDKILILQSNNENPYEITELTLRLLPPVEGKESVFTVRFPLEKSDNIKIEDFFALPIKPAQDFSQTILNNSAGIQPDDFLKLGVVLPLEEIRTQFSTINLQLNGQIKSAENDKDQPTNSPQFFKMVFNFSLPQIENKINFDTSSFGTKENLANLEETLSVPSNASDQNSEIFPPVGKNTFDQNPEATITNSYLPQYSSLDKIPLGSNAFFNRTENLFVDSYGSKVEKFKWR